MPYTFILPRACLDRDRPYVVHKLGDDFITRAHLSQEMREWIQETFHQGLPVNLDLEPFTLRMLGLPFNGGFLLETQITFHDLTDATEFKFRWF